MSQFESSLWALSNFYAVFQSYPLLRGLLQQSSSEESSTSYSDRGIFQSFQFTLILSNSKINNLTLDTLLIYNTNIGSSCFHNMICVDREIAWHLMIVTFLYCVFISFLFNTGAQFTSYFPIDSLNPIMYRLGNRLTTWLTGFKACLHTSCHSIATTMERARKKCIFWLHQF